MSSAQRCTGRRTDSCAASAAAAPAPPCCRAQAPAPGFLRALLLGLTASAVLAAPLGPVATPCHQRPLLTPPLLAVPPSPPTMPRSSLPHFEGPPPEWGSIPFHRGHHRLHLATPPPWTRSHPLPPPPTPLAPLLPRFHCGSSRPDSSRRPASLSTALLCLSFPLLQPHICYSGVPHPPCLSPRPRATPLPFSTARFRSVFPIVLRFHFFVRQFLCLHPSPGLSLALVFCLSATMRISVRTRSVFSRS